MIFSSATFLCVFLPILLLLYYAAPVRARNFVALAASSAFYAWGAPKFIFVLIATSWIDYVISGRLAPELGVSRRKHFLIVGLSLNLLTLLYCKYMNFFVDQANVLLTVADLSPIHWTTVVMPIGISFFTFQKISYLLDVYRGDASPADRFSRYLLYVMLFPQLIAGPIVRYRDVAQQLASREYSTGMFIAGAGRFAWGLTKKVIIADSLSQVVDTAFGSTMQTMVAPETLSCQAAWGAALCYAMQLYFDFSGYSDMAIGLGQMLGIRFLENFDHPYVSASIREFWGRWHISLSTFMREYLYFPLGGNRVRPWRAYGNLLVVFCVSGFWHGASWTFLVWGATHGLLYAIERYVQSSNVRPWPAAISRARTFLLVLLAWVFFRAWDLGQALSYLSVMFTGFKNGERQVLELNDIMSGSASAALLVALCLSFYPLLLPRLSANVEQSAAGAEPSYGWLLRQGVLTTVLLVVSFVGLVSSGFHPFIYFRF